MADCRFVTTDEARIGSWGNYMAVKMAESRAAEVAVSWFHLMNAPITSCLAVKVVLRQVGSTSG